MRITDYVEKKKRRTIRNEDHEKEIRCWNRRPRHKCETNDYHIGSGLKCSECISDHIARFENGMTCEEYYHMHGWSIYEE